MIIWSEVTQKKIKVNNAKEVLNLPLLDGDSVDSIVNFSKVWWALVIFFFSPSI